jgi:hypothetical protein
MQIGRLSLSLMEWTLLLCSNVSRSHRRRVLSMRIKKFYRRRTMTNQQKPGNDSQRQNQNPGQDQSQKRAGQSTNVDDDDTRFAGGKQGQGQGMGQGQRSGKQQQPEARP